MPAMPRPDRAPTFRELSKQFLADRQLMTRRIGGPGAARRIVAYGTRRDTALRQGTAPSSTPFPWGASPTSFEPEEDPSVDYSAMDAAVKEDIAGRVAMAVLEVENLAMLAQLPDHAFQSIMKLRQELRQLVEDLGGHPAVT